MIALADCYSFYASCEKVFRPDLKNKPVVVLSNNDGCLVAMSPEAKALGIGRAEPYFKVKKVLDSIGAAVFSSNYPLYQDISERVTSIYRHHFDRVEVYSIDESFIFPVENDSVDSLRRCFLSVRKDALKWTGIPISVGAGRSKTLAKLANRWAKKQIPEGVFVLTEAEEETLLERISVIDIWGIGPAKAQFLLGHGIDSALKLRNCDDWWIKKHLSVVTLYTIWELRGKPCIESELEPPPRKGIISGITFAEPRQKKEELLEAIACHCVTAAAKLRRQNSHCSILSVQINSNRFKKEARFDSHTISFDIPTAYPPDLIRGASLCLDRCFHEKTDYIRTAISIAGIEPAGTFSGDLFTPKSLIREVNAKRGFDKTLKNIEKRFGINAVVPATTGMKKKEQLMKRERLSPGYTTRWSDLPLIS